MGKLLHIGPKLTLPADTVTGTLIVYGGKGMGKSVFAAVVCEELSATSARFAVIDPMGVFWGLRHSADGKGPGIEVLILGGKHGDIPIEPTGGHVVADLVADESVDVIIDISRKPDGKMWSRGERIRFVADYCERLYERQGERRRPLLQIIDECGRFCPEQIRKDQPDIARCLGAVAELTEEARNVGVGVMLITQRSARMSKAVSELADAMIAFRTVGPRSVDAIMDWLGDNVPRERHKEIGEQLRKLARGTALVVSPGWLGIEAVADIRMRRTFDSSATPEAGKERKASGKGAMPDLARYQQRMTETIERVKAADPQALKKQLAEAQAVIRRLEARPPASQKSDKAVSNDTAPKAAENRRVAFERGHDAGVRQATAHFKKQLADYRAKVVKAAREVAFETKKASDGLSTELLRAVEHVGIASQKHKLLIQSAERTAEIWKTLSEAGTNFTDLAIAELPPAPDNLREPAPPVAKIPAPRPERLIREPVESNGEFTLKAVDRAFLTTLAQHPKGLSKGLIHLHSDYRSSGDTSASFAKLTRHGLMEPAAAGNGFSITEAGLTALGHYEPLPVGAELLKSMLTGDKLAKVERAILKVLADAYPEVVAKGEILNRANYKSSGDTSAAFARLVRFGFAKPAAGGLKLSKELTDAYETA
jgi:hypothetical protein